MSSPPSPTFVETPVEVHSPSRHTRTVAIIKNHALDHRFDIELRISEAGFEIVKERQMEFDVETDPDTMYELFGEDYVSFAEGPVWVYVLERRRAIEVWHTLMGDSDPEVARQESPNSLRALYGISREQNGVMGSSDFQIAETQIASIFASSPPFPTTDLPDVNSDSHTSGSLPREDYNGLITSPRGPASERSSGTRSSTVNGQVNVNGKPPIFRARTVPATNVKPDIVPRMSRAAALRVGIDIDAGKPRRLIATAESLAKTFSGVPGHKRSETIHVASTAPPTVAPRMTRAASLRLGQQLEPKPKVRPSISTTNSDTFEGVPGHKRRETITVASIRPPAVAPRINRSAALRSQKEAAAPPSAFNLRTPATISRSSSRTSINTVTAPTTARRPASSQGVTRPPISRTTTSSSSASKPSARPSSALALKPSNGATKPEPQTPAAKPKPRPSSIQAPPTIAPRTNKSALLRAAKMAAAGQNGNGVASKTPGPVKKAAIATRAVKATV